MSSSNKLYTFRGANTNNFYEYDIETDTWTTRAVAPAAVYRGGEVVEGPAGYLYGFRGENTTSFWRYDIEQDSWSDGDATDAPQTIYYGSSLIYDGNEYIYALRGNNDDSFLRYDVSGDVWESLTATDFGAPSAQVNNLVYVGGDLAWDGDDTLWAIQGNTRSGFAAYSISTDEWTSMPNLPALTYNGGQIEYDRTTNAVYYIPGWGKPFLFKFDLSTNNWTQLEDVPSGYLADGATLKNVDGELYVLRGGNNRYFYKYNIAKASWLIPTRGLFGGLFRGTDYRSFYYGADMVKGSGDYYYMTRGYYDNLFIRYDASTGESVELTGVPTGFYVGGALGYDSTNDKVYAIGSQQNQRLYVYDVATDVWSEEASDMLPTSPSSGTSFTYDGSRYLYWNRGGNTNTFYRYDTQAVAGSRWEALGNSPAGLGYGAQLIYKDGDIYTVRGQNVNPNPLYKYDVGTTSWSTLTGMPEQIYNDGFLVDGGGDYLYACRGANTDSCYRYSISGDSWTAIAGSPAQIYVGGSAQSNGSDKIYVIAGPGTNTYNDGLFTYVMQTSDSSFEESGNYVSQSHDLTAVYKFADLEVGCSLPSNTSLTSYTRTSADEIDWSSWIEVSSEKTVGTSRKYKINSTANRYIQVKFVLTSGDGIYSGVVTDYTINYYQDLDEPINATSLIGYRTATKSAILTSDGWANYSTPLFDWPDAEEVGGASDTSTGSGVAGYYIYFGVGETADPVSVGTTITSSEYQVSSLTSGETYYLRMKAYDNAGNVALGVGTTFVYKFDNEDPTNPQTVTVDPSGYTASNSFDFAWSGATDSASLVAEYCYKTGQVGSTEVCIGDVGVTGITAYDTGTNTFYVRAKDTAGNVPSQYSTASYYYNSIAPSPPQNLAVMPESNTVNEFAFSWDPPESYYGGQTGLRYYYSINNLPTANNVNTVGLSVTYLLADSYATQRGTNYFYVVAKDEAGNIDYSLYSMVEFSADTEAPGKPTGVEIGDISVKSTESWRLALSWDAPEATGSGIANYRVYRSTTDGADCTIDFTDFDLISTTSVASYVDVSLVQQDYYYCAKACTSTADCSIAGDTVTSYPDGRWLAAPDLVATPSASVKTKSAIITWSTSRTCSSFVQYGTASGDYGEEVGSSEHLSSHEVELEGLDPGTTYYFKALWTDEDGNTGESDEYTLTTNPAPIVSTVEIVDVGLYGVYIGFDLSSATKATVQYGETIKYGSFKEITTSRIESSYTVKLEDLEEGTKYHVRILAEDEEANAFYSDDYIFETLPVPKLSGVQILQVRGMPTATIRAVWKSNTGISSVITYYPEGMPEMSRDQIVLTLTKNHQMIIKDLLDDKNYVFVVKGKDKMGNEAKSEAKNMKIASDTRAPLISELKVEGTVKGVGDIAKASIVVTWKTDEESNAQVEYGQGTGSDYPNKTQEDNRMTVDHMVTVPDLEPGTVYHLRVLTKDRIGNLTESYDNVVVTPKATRSALDLVIDNLSKSFSFFGSLGEVVK
ncbi:fibronectin type III domain-containing protein [Patescibacteria group bacterium]|nr:fibronectin type III domain-containing protein [Patescibacteria group bacterium]MBU4265587.1 fibronectin type III domain-containing protein [Patescibacteria group bacterium]MBU4390817.1 fibronectin type III domain-containing protein [Patescibacteria group bacterium]MCG2702109.1 fibronectin type III domain-containing protein [Candidatus Parcubacteria bacterium]